MKVFTARHQGIRGACMDWVVECFHGLSDRVHARVHWKHRASRTANRSRAGPSGLRDLGNTSNLGLSLALARNAWEM